MVVLGAVIIAPITGEILYRGLIFATPLARGVNVVTAIVSMTALFNVIHLPNFGVAGRIFIAVWVLLPALLRIKYDNLAWAVCLHVLNNTYAYLVVALGMA